MISIAIEAKRLQDLITGNYTACHGHAIFYRHRKFVACPLTGKRYRKNLNENSDEFMGVYTNRLNLAQLREDMIFMVRQNIAGAVG